MISIAIDGPAGAGKSSIAKLAAKELSFIYVDTGALYRAVGWYVLSCGKDPADAGQVVPLLKEISVELRFVEGEQHVFLNGRDVSTEIRLPEVSMAASRVSAIPEVRDFLFSLQRELAEKNNVLMDGRDIGTVVLPNAQIKIFLTASAENRADRRMKQLAEAGNHVDYNTLLAEIKERDYNDSHRAIAPLKQAEDAKLVDTTGLTLEESVKLVLDYIADRMKELKESR